MPLKPTLFERVIFGAANQGPGPILDLVGALGFKAVQTALKLGLFEALEKGAADPGALAGRIGAHERGVRFLLEALEPLGYVERAGEAFANSAMTRRWLVESSDARMGDLFHYFNDMLERWDRLDESVRQGGGAVDGAAWSREHPGSWQRYHAGMRAVARLTAPEIVERVAIPAGARRLIDLGGSHGLYAARFLRKHPALTATVFDWAEARPIAEETLAAEGMGERLAFREGDLFTDDYGTGWDVALLFSVARIFPREALDTIFRKTAAALAPGGRLVIVDQLVERPPTPFLRANARLIDLELFNATKGDIHKGDDLVGWMAEAGLRTVERFDLRRSGGQGVIVAERR